MKTLLDNIALITQTLASLAPFFGIGFYFGKLEKRVKKVEKDSHTHPKLSLIKNQ